MKKKKKTATVVMNLQVTVIFDDEIEKPDIANLAEEIKKTSGVDDVVVTNAKVFIN